MNTPACHAIRKAGMIVMRWANIAVLIVSLGSSILKSNKIFHNTLPKRKRVAKNMIPPMTAPMIATTIAALNSWMSMSIMSCFIFYCFAVLWKQIVPQKYGFFLRDDSVFYPKWTVFVHRHRKNGLFLRDMLLGVCREVENWSTKPLKGNTARYRFYSRWSLSVRQRPEPQPITPYPLRPEQYPIKRNLLWDNGLRSSLRRPQKIVPRKHCDFCGTICCSTIRTISHAHRKNGQ